MKETYTLAEAHRRFAQQSNGRVWELLSRPQRMPDEEDELLDAAHASRYHWRQIGDAAQRQRGEWLLSRVYGVLGRPAEALDHARRCLALTEADPAAMADFDFAYAYEGMARVCAQSGEHAEAAAWLARAVAAGEAIANDEDRSIFQGDLNAGEWYGLR